jgi:hypothetical protein
MRVLTVVLLIALGGSAAHALMAMYQARCSARHTDGKPWVGGSYELVGMACVERIAHLKRFPSHHPSVYGQDHGTWVARCPHPRPAR